MQKVLMTLFIIMHIVFVVGYFINSGIIFFTMSFWLIFCIISIIVGLRYHFSTTHIKIKDLTYRILAWTLVIISTLSFLFILYLYFVNPYVYLDFRS